ncbi:MAG: hypothetical protein IPG60_10740 [Bacteroidetes bacterium]|nr:hypothetical protein [Bacteroidota bacterium]
MVAAKNISLIGEIFIKKVLENNIGVKDDLRKDWKKSFEFLLFHAFMRGRRDSLSIRFKDNTMRLLSDYLNQSQIKIKEDVGGLTAKIATFKEKEKLKQSNNALKIPDLFFENFSNNKFITCFNENENNQFLVGNDKDIIMVAEVLNMITDERTLPAQYELNFYNYTIECLIEGKIHEIKKTLEDVKFIGDKLSSFYIRNVVKLEGLFQLEGNIEHHLPIDRWINKVCVLLKIYNESDSIESKKNKMRDYCSNNNVNQIEFNQGAWLIGFDSFKLLFELLSKHEILVSLDLENIEIFKYIND